MYYLSCCFFTAGIVEKILSACDLKPSDTVFEAPPPLLLLLLLIIIIIVILMI